MFATAFHFFGTPVPYLELLAFVLSVACVACNIRRWPVAWPLTIAASGLYAWFFFTNKLYGDGALQFVFIAMAVWGWWQWVYARDASANTTLKVSRLPPGRAMRVCIVWLVTWLAMGLFLKRFTDTDVPWWDGFVTAGSLVATWMLAKKYVENWPLWLLINAVAIPLFFYKKFALTVVLYVILFAIAVHGWIVWRREIGRT